MVDNISEVQPIVGDLVTPKAPYKRLVPSTGKVWDRVLLVKCAYSAAILFFHSCSIYAKIPNAIAHVMHGILVFCAIRVLNLSVGPLCDSWLTGSESGIMGARSPALSQVVSCRARQPISI